MPVSFRSHIALVAREHSDFGTPELLDDIVNSRNDTHIAVSTKDDALSLHGTMDELLNFATEIIRAVYGWCIITHNTDWLGDETHTENGDVVIHATTGKD